MARTLVVRTAGTNCDAEMVRAFRMCGAEVDLVHLERLIADPDRLDSYDLFGFPGGFSYGDDVASGRVLAMKLRLRLYEPLQRAAARGAPMIGVCNGFQVMVQLGLLPGPEAPGAWSSPAPPEPSLALVDNAGGRFIDRWVRVEVPEQTRCVWTRGLWTEGADANERDERARDAIMRLPLASGEGRLVARDEGVLDRLESNGQIALRYVENVNGSARSIAGVCDASGRIFGLMPHPDRYLDWRKHPFWTRMDAGARPGDPPGLKMFRNAVEAVRVNPTPT